MSQLLEIGVSLNSLIALPPLYVQEIDNSMYLASCVLCFASFCLFLVFHILRSGSGPEVQGKPERRFPPHSFSFSLVLIPSHFLRLPRSSSLFLAGQRLMDIHSNEVKAINNSSGNAYPHLVPFLLKSSVCNKRSSRSREKEKERKTEKE